LRNCDCILQLAGIAAIRASRINTARSQKGREGKSKKLLEHEGLHFSFLNFIFSESQNARSETAGGGVLLQGWLKKVQ
jgi:hypothetical protein